MSGGRSGNTGGRGTPGGFAGMSQPPSCGNGIIDPGELCDGANLGGETCGSATMNSAPVGTLACTRGCFPDTSSCRSPGSGGAGSMTPIYECHLYGPISPPVSPPDGGAQLCGSWMGGPAMGMCLKAEPQGDLAIAQDTCDVGDLCIPLTKIGEPRCFEQCESELGGAGACVPTYVVEASPGGAGLSDVLGQATCEVGETCTPCIHPIDGSITGACRD
jgi:hypothetical protein